MIKNDLSGILIYKIWRILGDGEEKLHGKLMEVKEVFEIATNDEDDLMDSIRIYAKMI